METATLLCQHCETPLLDVQKYCTQCGYPQGGTAGEKSRFHSERIMKAQKVKDAPKVIKNARTLLYVVAGITFLHSIIMYFGNATTDIFISNGILCLTYLVLGFWSQKKPLIALILGLMVYGTVIVINALVEPESMYKGIILKVIVVIFLIRGIHSAIELRRIR